MPDVAITISVPGMSEAELLDYMVPEFWWRNITNGFTNRSSDKTLMQDVQYGSACELRAGYECAGTGEHRDCAGHRPWPVFCIKGTEKHLRGRFGDDEWKYVQIKLDRCAGGDLTTSLRSLWSTDGSGDCATDVAVATALGEEVGINVWFRFHDEDWKKSGTLRGPKESGMIEPGWTWFIFESVLTTASQDEVSLSNHLSVDLRYNNATVNSRYDLRDNPNTTAWFDFGSYVRFPGGINPSADEPFFSANLQVASTAREISVRFPTLMQLISEISGFWPAALLSGWIFCVLCEKLLGETDDVLVWRDPGQSGCCKQCFEPVLKFFCFAWCERCNCGPCKWSYADESELFRHEIRDGNINEAELVTEPSNPAQEARLAKQGYLPAIGGVIKGVLFRGGEGVHAESQARAASSAATLGNTQGTQLEL